MLRPYINISGQAVGSTGLLADPPRTPDVHRGIREAQAAGEDRQSKRGAMGASHHARRSKRAAA
jgi:hypothetical protein